MGKCLAGMWQVTDGGWASELVWLGGTSKVAECVQLINAAHQHSQRVVSGLVQVGMC